MWRPWSVNREVLVGVSTCDGLQPPTSLTQHIWAQCAELLKHLQPLPLFGLLCTLFWSNWNYLFDKALFKLSAMVKPSRNSYFISWAKKKFICTYVLCIGCVRQNELYQKYGIPLTNHKYYISFGGNRLLHSCVTRGRTSFFSLLLFPFTFYFQILTVPQQPFLCNMVSVSLCVFLSRVGHAVVPLISMQCWFNTLRDESFSKSEA